MFKLENSSLNLVFSESKLILQLEEVIHSFIWKQLMFIYISALVVVFPYHRAGSAAPDDDPRTHAQGNQPREAEESRGHAPAIEEHLPSRHTVPKETFYRTLGSSEVNAEHPMSDEMCGG